jgi:hypothetical protein
VCVYAFIGNERTLFKHRQLLFYSGIQARQFNICANVIVIGSGDDLESQPSTLALSTSYM